MIRQCWICGRQFYSGKHDRERFCPTHQRSRALMEPDRAPKTWPELVADELDKHERGQS